MLLRRNQDKLCVAYFHESGLLSGRDLQMHFKLHTIFTISLLSHHAMYVYSSFVPSRLSKYCLSISASMHF